MPLTPRTAWIRVARNAVNGQLSFCSQRFRSDGGPVYIRGDGWQGPQLTTPFQTPLNPEMLARIRLLIDGCLACNGPSRLSESPRHSEVRSSPAHVKTERQDSAAGRIAFQGVGHQMAPRTTVIPLFTAFIHPSSPCIRDLTHLHLRKLRDAARSPREDVFDGHNWSITPYVSKMGFTNSGRASRGYVR